MESNEFFKWIRQNFIILVVCLLAIMSCLLIYGNSANTLNACNNYYQEQFKENCVGNKYTGFNFSMEDNKVEVKENEIYNMD